MKYRKTVDGEKKALKYKNKKGEQRLRKTPIPESASGLKSALHEWARALLGLPRQSTSPSSSKVKVLENTLPTSAQDTEVEAWITYSTSRETYLDMTVKRDMDRLLAKNPSATEASKNELKKRVTKRAVESYEKEHHRAKFISRVAKATASVYTYDPAQLSFAEAALAQCGFPRLTFQWTSSISTQWNMATINSLVSSWLNCYNARAVPSSYFIDSTKINVPMYAKEILIQWVQTKRSVYSQQLKDLEVAAQDGGKEKLEKKKKSEAEKKKMKDLKKKVGVPFQSIYFQVFHSADFGL
jgi:hypothetical protein